MKASIIIPTLNEKETLQELLDLVDNVKLPAEKEIVIVDGNSTDGTKDIIKDFASERDYVSYLFERKPKGKGSAVRKGIKKSTGDVIIIQDGDLEVSPEELPRLLEPIINGESEAVFGSRFLNGRGLCPKGSYIGNKIITIVMNILFFSSLTDIATCHKLVKKDVVDKLKLKADSFDFDSEITAKLLKRKYKILEKPIKYIPRSIEDGKKLRWSVGFKVVFAIIRYRIFL